MGAEPFQASSRWRIRKCPRRRHPSAFEGRVALVRVPDDAAEEIAGADADIAKDHWQTLEVVADGDGFTISLDDRWVLTAFDRHAVLRTERSRYGPRKSP
jgi:hypothetical protein